MIQTDAKTKTKDFVKHIELLSQSASDQFVVGFRGKEPERDFLRRIIADTCDLIERLNATNVASDLRI